MQSLRYILLSALLVISGCATMTTNNYTPTNLPAHSLGIIAADIAPIIAARNPAKKISFILHRDDFGRYLAQKLGQLGYEVMFNGQTQATRPPANAEKIRYTIDWVSHQPTVYIALTVNDNQRYTRTYTVNHGALVPNPTKIIGIGVRNGR